MTLLDLIEPSSQGTHAPLLPRAEHASGAHFVPDPVLESFVTLVSILTPTLPGRPEGRRVLHLVHRGGNRDSERPGVLSRDPCWSLTRETPCRVCHRDLDVKALTVLHWPRTSGLVTLTGEVQTVLRLQVFLMPLRRARHLQRRRVFLLAD